MSSYTDVEELLNYLKHNKFVKYININSTMGRRLNNSATTLPVDHEMISGKNKGKALVICTRNARPGWETEYQQACQVFQQQLGLQVINFVKAFTCSNVILCIIY